MTFDTPNRSFQKKKIIYVNFSGVQSYLCSDTESVILSKPKRFVENRLVCKLVTVQLPPECLIRRS